MRSLVIALFTFLIPAVLNAQLTVSKSFEMRSPLIETFGGNLCAYNPDASLLGDTLMATYPTLSFIEIHAGAYSFPNSANNYQDLRTTEGDLIHGYNGVVGYPMGSVNRKYFPTETATAVSRGKWESYSLTILGDTSPVNINVNAYMDPSSGNMKVEVAMYFTKTDTAPHYLNLALTQDNIVGYQSGASRYPARVIPGGSYIQKNVLRDMITPVFGQLLNNTTKGTSFNQTFTYTPQTINGIAFDTLNMNVVAFVTKGTGFTEVVTAKTYRGTGKGVPSPVSSLSGVITMNGLSSLTDTRRVYLIKQDTSFSSPYLVAVDSLDTQDTFQFNNVPTGTYYLKAAVLPGQPNYASYIPSYYYQDLLWVNADTIDHVYNTQGRTLDIVQGINTGGPGFIGGYVSQGANFAPGDPLKGVHVILYDSLLTPITYDITDVNGRYEFSNLAAGSYLVYIDALNIVPTPKKVVLKLNDPVSDDNDFNLDQTGAVPVGITNTTDEQSAIEVYPIPALNVLNISKGQAEMNRVQIINTSGQTVMDQAIYSNHSEIISLDVSNLYSGMYFLRMTSDSKVETRLIQIK